MKRSAIFSAFLIVCAAVALAQSPPPTRFSNSLLNDVVRMTKAGMADATIVAYVKARRARLDSTLSADDLIQLRGSGVDEPVIQYLAGVGALDEGRSGEGRQRDVGYDSGDGNAYPVAPADGGVYAYPYDYGYWPYGFSGSVFIGGRPFFGHRFFFRRPFIHHRFFFRHSASRRFFFRPPFIHHRVFFSHPVGRRSFFRGRR